MSRWSPYQNNGGSAVAICGKGFCLVGADTRMSAGYQIENRNVSKCFQPTGSTVLASGGMQADRMALQKNMSVELTWFKHNNQNKVPDVASLSKKLSVMLYQRRFGPYYAFNLLAGLDSNGDGVCYSYDVIGCTEPVKYAVVGTGEALIEPFLDNQMLRQHQRVEAPELSLEDAKNLLKTAFSAAAERDIYTGDQVEIFILTPKGTEKEIFPLRRD